MLAWTSIFSGKVRHCVMSGQQLFDPGQSHLLQDLSPHESRRQLQQVPVAHLRLLPEGVPPTCMPTAASFRMQHVSAG
jgi:hypothetical protein